MFKRYGICLCVLLVLFAEVSTAGSNNPFAKQNSLNIGKDISWNIDNESVLATKSARGDSGNYYHLQFDNKQLKLLISSDAKGDAPEAFTQLEIKDVKIDGKRSPLFNWCLNNQQRHSRFLQQGLSVKKNICEVDGNAGSFVMNLNKEALMALNEGKRLSIMIKPYRTPLNLNYDITDFENMYLVLNSRSVPVAAEVQAIEESVVSMNKKCWAGPPAKYKNIKSVEYDCSDAAAKKDAEAWVVNLVSQQKAKDQKIALAAAEKNRQKERQRLLAEEKKQKQLAEQLKIEEQLQAEQAAVAASVVKQSQIGDEITQKMLKVCDKYWSKGQHRCYCQKYIEHAPSAIQANSSCK